MNNNEPTQEEIDASCAIFRKNLDETVTKADPLRARRMALFARYDQDRAKCRDDDEFRERFIESWREQGGEREDVEYWLEHGEMP
jgi:hypothetical protein